MTEAEKIELIASALVYAGGTHTPADVLEAIALGHMVGWEGEHSIVVTEINQFPRLRELQFFLAAGDMQELRTLYPIILEYAKAQGCARAVLAGRPGWLRSFLTKDEGWRAALVVCTKEL